MPAFRALYVKSGWDEKLEGNKGDDYSFYFIYFLQAEGELQKMDEAVTMERDGVGQRGRRRRERRKRGNIGNEGSASDLSSAQRIITCLPGCREHQQQQSTTVSVRCCSCARFSRSCRGKMLTDAVQLLIGINSRCGGKTLLSTQMTASRRSRRP